MEKTVKPPAKSAAKVFDVAKPGKSMATATSRPVIVSNGPLLPDPMMSDGSSDARPGVGNSPRLTIKPLSDDDGTDKKVAVNKKPVEEAPAAEAEAPKDVPKDEPQAPETEEKVEEPAPETSETEEVPADIGGDTPPSLENKAQKEAEAAAKQQAELDKLTESRDYFLPINAVERRRSKVVVWSLLVLSLVLGLVLVNFLLDADVLTINGVKPLTNLFNQ